tara:strand:+ start:3625 stop:3891 length:267 start_codon:yes stop_codon:yes gene_type:complete
MIKVSIVDEKGMLPFLVEFGSVKSSFTKKAAIELREKLDIAINELNSIEMLSTAPCIECGAMNEKEAEKLCNCSGDKDDCHGCQLWPE